MIIIIHKYVQGTLLIVLISLTPCNRSEVLSYCICKTKYPSIFCHITATGYAHTTFVLIAGFGATRADAITNAVKFVASASGGREDIANIDTKAFILKCFAKSINITIISTVVVAVHVITKTLLSHLGIIFCIGWLASLSSIVGILCPSVPVVSKKLSKSTVDPISLSMYHTNLLKMSAFLQYIGAVYWNHCWDFFS